MLPHRLCYIYPARLLNAGTAGYMFCCCFLFKKTFLTILTIYLKIYSTDLCQISTFGRTMAVDDQSEISFSVPRWTLPWQPVFERYYRSYLTNDFIATTGILYGRYAAEIYTYYYYRVVFHHSLNLSFQAQNLPFLQILPTVAFLFFCGTDSTDSTDCLPILLSISVFF